MAGTTTGSSSDRTTARAADAGECAEWVADATEADAARLATGATRQTPAGAGRYTGPSADDRAAKQRRIAAVRAAHGGAPLVLTSHEALAWYLDGARTHVSLAGPPVLAVRVDDAGDTLFASANEVDRLVAEELLPEDAARIVPVPWAEPVADAALAAVEAAPALKRHQ